MDLGHFILSNRGFQTVDFPGLIPSKHDWSCVPVVSGWPSDSSEMSLQFAASSGLSNTGLCSVHQSKYEMNSFCQSMKMGWETFHCIQYINNTLPCRELDCISGYVTGFDGERTENI